MGEVAEKLRARLETALEPEHLEIIDDSRLHAGHAGARPEGETHFRVVIVSRHFAGLSRVERQRVVHRAAGDLLEERIHAFSAQALTPGEAAS